MPEAEGVRLIAHTDIPTVELTVLDGRFQFVHRSVGSLDITLPPGNYLLQYHAGSDVTEVPVMLRSGAGPVTVPAPQLSTRSPAPLAGGDAAQRYGAFARAASREIHERRGEGGELFLFIRTSTQDLKRGIHSESLFDARLLDRNRRVVVDLRESGKRSDDKTAVGCNVELAPGTYLIRYKIGESEELEQTIVVSPGWQTQLFSSSRPYGDAAHYGPNFPEAALIMVPRGDGFDPNDRGAVIAESARLSLAGSCAVAPEARLRTVSEEVSQIRASAPQEQVGEMLREKFRNPMLGIYGAHLLLLNAERRWDVIIDTVATLKSLLGPHPDVLALTSLEPLRHLSDNLAFDLPPMLRNSWALVVGNSSEQPHMVPASSYAAGIAKRVWGSDGWLVWRAPEPRPAAASRRLPSRAQLAAPTMTTREAIASIHQQVLDQYRTLGPAELLKRTMSDPRLSDTERAIVAYAISAVHQDRNWRTFRLEAAGLLARAATYVRERLEHYKWADRFTGALTLDPSIQEALALPRLIPALGVPAAALNEALVELAEKLASSPAPPDQVVTRSPVSG